MEKINEFIFTKFKYRKGMPIRCLIDNQETLCLYFKEIDKDKIQVLILNNEFKESSKLIINKNKLL